ncbi:amidohydrolase family protein [Gaetbulibacter aestuarii]|uniref:Amidohydrolase family protein n=1 Tax=Gaetbulibacter aestuarii TaxID=1502358 RepID=A0ABW7MXW5_9FLAO
MKTLFNYILMLCTIVSMAQQTPAPKQTKTIAIVGATAHIGNGSVINNSIIILKDGKIDALMDATQNTTDFSGFEVIDAKGHDVYPGFIVPNSTLGLIEIDAVRASEDDAELGQWNPNVRSLIAYNAESKIVETMRPNGVLMGQITPQGGRISGTSSVVQFDAWNWEDAAVKVDDAIHMNWPRTTSSRRGEITVNKKYGEEVEAINSYFDNAKAYNQGNKTTTNLPFEALDAVFKGSKKLFIHVEEEKGIIDAVDFAKSHDIKNLVIVDAQEAYKTIELLKANNIPVVLTRVHSLPEHEDDDYDQPFKNATILTQNGITVALEVAGAGRMERMQSRNLPFYAGTTVSRGLTKEQALQLITLNPAKILGIDDQYGTLEAGKSATLFISKGDALDMRTNQITHAFIDGRMISLETHQTELWKRYSNKYKKQS